jgi:GNAT superfamily N-acetyltransferase
MPPDIDEAGGLDLRVETETGDIQDELIENVRSFNDEILGKERSRPLAAVARDEAGALVGGVSGRTFYRWLLIDVVWVHEDLRGTGLGARLMAMAEAEAVERGCIGVQVDTVTFQAPGFYSKLGYEPVGTVEGFPPGYARHYFSKRLA